MYTLQVFLFYLLFVGLEIEYFFYNSMLIVSESLCQFCMKEFCFHKALFIDP